MVNRITSDYHHLNKSKHLIKRWNLYLAYEPFSVSCSMSDTTISFVCLLLFYARATVFQLYQGGDMIYEKEKAQAYTLLTQGIFNLPHHIGMV